MSVMARKHPCLCHSEMIIDGKIINVEPYAISISEYGFIDIS